MNIIEWWLLACAAALVLWLLRRPLFALWNRIPWAPDAWWGIDKLEHFATAYLGLGTLVALDLGFWFTSITAHVAAWGVEFVIEHPRYRAWERKGTPSPWPYLCDLPSYKDLVYDYAGYAALLLTLYIRSLF